MLSCSCTDRLKRRENFLNAIDPEKEAEVRAAAYGEDIKRERKRQLREEGSRQKTYGRRMSRGEGPAMRAAYLQEGLEDDSRYCGHLLRICIYAYMYLCIRALLRKHIGCMLYVWILKY